MYNKNFRYKQENVFKDNLFPYRSPKEDIYIIQTRKNRKIRTTWVSLIKTGNLFEIAFTVVRGKYSKSLVNHVLLL